MTTGTPQDAKTGGATPRAWVEVVSSALAGAGLDEARVRAEWLVAHAMGCRRLELPLQGAEDVTAEAEQLIRSGLARLLRHEPLQYILGTADFMGHVLRVDRRVLIPRPETEQLVEQVLADAGLRPGAKPRLADVGTGSGCVAIALAAALPGAGVVATDISREALELARDNAARRGVGARIEFREADLLEGVALESLDAVVSNPPYVTTDEWRELEPCVRLFEPRRALDGGPDGLDVIRRLVTDALRALRAGGGLFVEIGERQGGEAKALTEAAGFTNVEVRRDGFGRDRFLCARKM